MSKSRGRYEDDEDDARPVSTGSDKGSSWSGRPIKHVKLALYALLGLSLFLYSWTVFFSERVSISNVSPDLLGASSILWLVAHRKLQFSVLEVRIDWITTAVTCSGR